MTSKPQQSAQPSLQELQNEWLPQKLSGFGAPELDIDSSGLNNEHFRELANHPEIMQNILDSAYEGLVSAKERDHIKGGFSLTAYVEIYNNHFQSLGNLGEYSFIPDPTAYNQNRLICETGFGVPICLRIMGCKQRQDGTLVLRAPKGPETLIGVRQNRIHHSIQEPLPFDILPQRSGVPNILNLFLVYQVEHNLINVYLGLAVRLSDKGWKLDCEDCLRLIKDHPLPLSDSFSTSDSAESELPEPVETDFEISEKES